MNNGVSESKWSGTCSADAVSTTSCHQTSRPSVQSYSVGTESVRLPFVDQSVIVMFDRFDLQYIGASTDKTVGAIINVPATIAAASV